jgi:D-alanine-D-alanine ligase
VGNEERIGVLAGGDSPEREISLVSGEHVHRALRNRGRNVRLIALETLDDLFPALADVDVVFNCLHGGSGEDGTVQILLDVMRIPYAGSSARACARAMDKVYAKTLFETMRVPTPPGLALGGGDPEVFCGRVRDALSAPFVVKPTNLGSTIGVVVVDDEAELRSAVVGVAGEYGDVLVESYIAGRELTVGILRGEEGDAALPVIEIRVPDALFDYTAKYTEGVAQFVVPAELPDDVASRVQAVSLQAHQTLGCTGYSRADLRLAEDDTPYVLEVNTIPGMTPISDLPRAAAAAGIPFEDLVEQMLRTTWKGDD